MNYLEKNRFSVLISSANKALIFILFIILQNGYSLGLVEDSTHVNHYIPMSDISFQYEKLINDLDNLKTDIHPSPTILKIDSSYKLFSKQIDSLEVKTIQDSSRYSIRLLSSFINEWNGYKEKLHEWQLDVLDHAQLLELLRDSLAKKSENWKYTQEIAIDKDAPESVKQRIESALDSIGFQMQNIKIYDSKLAIIQDDIMHIIMKVDDVVDFLEQAKINYKGKLFVLDSSPLWEWRTDKSPLDFYTEINANFEDQKRTLILFTQEHFLQFLLHLFVFLFLLFTFIWTRKNYLDSDLPGDDNRLTMAYVTIKSPLYAALVITTVLSIYFYKTVPDIVVYFLSFVIIIPSLHFFPRFVKVYNIRLLYLLVILFFLDKIQDMIVVDHLVGRVFQLIKASTVLYVIYMAFQKQRSKQSDNKGWQMFTKATVPVFALIILISVISNIIGAFQLSELLIEGVLTSTVYSIIFFVAAVVASSFLVILLRSKSVSSLKVFSENKSKFENRITYLIYLVAIFYWFKITLSSFQLFDNVVFLYNDFLDLNWVIGKVTISMGGIISFLFILFVTFLIARLVKELINDQIIPARKATRGLPNAFSMVIRYVVVTLGAYIALSVVGINLGEFSLMAGALGVGLGFGLQNILHNLVSGLIVSFERPIHVGDIVEVASIMGIVTEIGVRSSKIRTFQGSEVILPNGDLLSKQVINWTLSDQKRRLEVTVRSSFNADPHEVLALLNTVLAENENILTTPSPMTLFEGYGDSALNFKVLFWVPLNIGLSTKSQVALSIYDKLKEKNIEAPIHQQRLLYQDGSDAKNRPM